MKANLFFLALVLASMVFVVPVAAEETTEPTGAMLNENAYKEGLQKKRQEAQEERQEKKMEVKATIQQKREENQEKREARRSEVAQHHAERLEIRFTAYYDRLMKIADKIQTRIDTLKSEGHDTSGAQIKLDEAKASLASARTLSLEAVAKFKSIDPDNYESQRAVAMAAKETANEARDYYQKAVEQLKVSVVALQALK